MMLLDKKLKKLCSRLEHIAESPIIIRDDCEAIRKAVKAIGILSEMNDTNEEIIADLKEEVYRLEERIGMMTDK